jgi:hypothetical protein
VASLATPCCYTVSRPTGPRASSSRPAPNQGTTSRHTACDSVPLPRAGSFRACPRNAQSPKGSVDRRRDSVRLWQHRPPAARPLTPCNVFDCRSMGTPPATPCATLKGATTRSTAHPRAGHVPTERARPFLHGLPATPTLLRWTSDALRARPGAPLQRRRHHRLRLHPPPTGGTPLATVFFFKEPR